MESKLRIVIGLGMPLDSNGFNNRHSVGAQCVSLYAAQHNRVFETAASEDAAVVEFHIPKADTDYPNREDRILVVKPLVHVNNSGIVLSRFVTDFQVPKENIMVIHDDLDLQIGKIRLRTEGGHGGHNGVKSIIEHLGMSDFFRVKIGIGRPKTTSDIRSYVLDSFSPEEEVLIGAARSKVCRIIESWITLGTEEAVNRFNGGLLA